MWLKRYDLRIFLFLALVATLFSQAELLINFSRGQHEEHFSKIILNLDQWFRRWSFKIFLIYSSGGPFVQGGRTISAISVKGIMRNNSVKSF